MKRSVCSSGVFIYSACLLFFSYTAVCQPGKKPVPGRPPVPGVSLYVYPLQKLYTDFFIPPRVGRGDKDFGGNGPDITCSVNISVSADKTKIIAHITMDAKESKSDWTESQGSVDKVIFTCRSGQGIISITSPTSSHCNYTDRDHDDDFVKGGGTGETSTAAQNSNWELRDMNYSDLVAFYRFSGDNDGDDAGTKTGVQIFFNPIVVNFSGTLMDEVQLRAEEGSGTCGNNTCASSASTTFLKYYHTAGLVSCDHFKELYGKVIYSPNIASYIQAATGENIGVDPNTVRDRLKEYRPSVTLEETNNPTVMDHINTMLAANKPVIALTGWGSKTIRDFYARKDDNISLNPNSVLHYIVIDGINRQTKTYSIIDNGTRKYLSGEYLCNIILWHPENFVIESALYGAQTKPGKIIY